MKEKANPIINSKFAAMKKWLYLISIMLFFVANTNAANSGFFGAREAVVAKGGTFTAKQIDEYVKLATKNPDAKKVMLGMWDNGAATSYVNKAGKEYSHFSLGAKWDEIYELVNKNSDEMWRINKQFIDEQHIAKKEFWFSHDPYSPRNEQSFAREVNYLIYLGVKDFEKVGDVWKAVW